ncbi:MAG: DUF1489 domain-containing protein [Pseudomonadota bacterium]
MALHLVKLCVGATSIDDLEAWVARRVAFNKRRGLGPVHDHVTRMTPRRRDELLDGGSLYWVIKGVVSVRQKLLGLETAAGEDGVRRCAILLDPPLIRTQAQPKAAFQGWRYLTAADAPPDVAAGDGGDAPERLKAELAALGLL